MLRQQVEIGAVQLTLSTLTIGNVAALETPTVISNYLFIETNRDIFTQLTNDLTALYKKKFHLLEIKLPLEDFQYSDHEKGIFISKTFLDFAVGPNAYKIEGQPKLIAANKIKIMVEGSDSDERSFIELLEINNTYQLNPTLLTQIGIEQSPDSYPVHIFYLSSADKLSRKVTRTIADSIRHADDTTIEYEILGKNIGRFGICVGNGWAKRQEQAKLFYLNIPHKINEDDNIGKELIIFSSTHMGIQLKKKITQAIDNHIKNKLLRPPKPVEILPPNPVAAVEEIAITGNIPTQEKPRVINKETDQDIEGKLEKILPNDKLINITKEVAEVFKTDPGLEPFYILYKETPKEKRDSTNTMGSRRNAKTKPYGRTSATLGQWWGTSNGKSFNSSIMLQASKELENEEGGWILFAKNDWRMYKPSKAYSNLTFDKAETLDEQQSINFKAFLALHENRHKHPDATNLYIKLDTFVKALQIQIPLITNQPEKTPETLKRSATDPLEKKTKKAKEDAQHRTENSAHDLVLPMAIDSGLPVSAITSLPSIRTLLQFSNIHQVPGKSGGEVEKDPSQQNTL